MNSRIDPCRSAQRLLLCLCALTFGPLRVAAQNNVVSELRDALSPPAAVWGEIRVGIGSGREPDARAAHVGGRLTEALAQFRRNGPLPAPQPGPADPQRQAIQRLEQQAGGNVEVLLRGGNRTVMQIRGKPLGETAQGIAKANGIRSSELTARTFFRAHRAVLRLEDPDGELEFNSEQQDSTGERHLKFVQKYQGLPVWGAGLSAHFDARGNVVLIDGAYVPSPSAALLEPGVTAGEAIAQAKATVLENQPAITTDPTLIIYAPLHGVPRLAWKLDLSVGILHAWEILVDARDGRILSRVTRVCHGNATGAARDMGGTLRSLNLWSADGKFYLADTSKQMFNSAADPIMDPRGVISIFDAREVTSEKLNTVFLMESADANTWIADGVSALFNFGYTYDYFLERFNRNSLDGRGGNIQAVVRIAQMDNAFWNGNLHMMFFGNVRPYPAALDVVGHELSHGIIQNSADLIYELQPGAINEAFADIFGEMIEARTQGRPDWKIGQSLGKIFRDMQNPNALQIGGLNRPYPAKMSQYLDLANSEDSDHGGVHLNSSIINHCFYLLAEGLPGAIGLRDAEKVFYRCLTVHLQKQSQFIDVRLGCIAAAEALFGAGSAQAGKTVEAFDAVEIFATPPTPEPSPIPAVSGQDSTLLVTLNPFTEELALGRRESVLNDPFDGVWLAEPLKEARPAVSGDGSLAIYVSAVNDLCAVSTAAPETAECLGLAGTIHSVALSPDGTLAAFVLLDPITGQPDNQISVYNLDSGQIQTFTLLAPVLDSNPVDQVLFADAMIFTSDSKQLIYDAVSEIRFGAGAATQRWSIFRINLATESTTVLVPPLEAADFGNPNLGRMGNRYLTFDARGWQTGESIIINLDLFTGEVAQVGIAGRTAGYPCFTGDESAIIYATEDPDATFTGISLAKQELASNRLDVQGEPTLWLPDAPIGVIYRRGTFVGSNHLPAVALTSPADNSTYSTGSSVTLTATASDPDGAISKVEFYNGAAKLGESTNAPYRFVWANVPAGKHRAIARAYDNLGAATDSAAVNLTVGETAGSSIRLSGARSGAGVRIVIDAVPGPYQLQRSTDLRSWIDGQRVTIGPSGSASIDEPTDGTRRFYRVTK